MSNIIQGVGRVLATMFVWIMIFYIFLPNAHFKLISTLISDMGVAYYDVVTPLFLLMILWESYFWIVKAKV